MDSGHPGVGALEPIGIAEAEERVYQALLEQPGAPLSSISTRLKLSRRRIESALSDLQARGLVTRSPSQPPRYMPTPPEAAIELLVLRRQEDLGRVRMTASLFAERLRGALGPQGTSLVEEVAGHDAVAQSFAQLLRGSRDEVLVFDRPPYREDFERGQPWDVEVSVLTRGVRIKTIYDRQALEIPGVIEEIQALIPLGEEARFLSGVPMKLLVSDRRVAIIPMGPGLPYLEAAVLVHESPLLDAVIVLFETLWQRADPFASMLTAPADANLHSQLAVSPTERRIIALLASGYQDAAIARTLRLGHRTVGRHIKHLMSLVGAETRFQLGAAADRLGWLRSQGDRNQ